MNIINEFLKTPTKIGLLVIGLYQIRFGQAYLEQESFDYLRYNLKHLLIFSKSIAIRVFFKQFTVTQVTTQ